MRLSAWENMTWDYLLLIIINRLATRIYAYNTFEVKFKTIDYKN